LHRLPVFATAGRAFQFLLHEAGTILRLSWFPLLFVAIIQYFMLRSHFAAMRSALEAGGPAALSGFSSMWQWQIANAVVTILGSAVVAVALHRVILLGDRKPGRYLYAAFGKVEMLFSLLPIIVIVPFTVVAALVFGLSAAFVPRSLAALTVFLFVLAWSALIFVAIRLELILPITVLERRYDFTQAWSLTRGNFWRIVGLWLVVLIPVALVAGTISIVTSPFGALVPTPKSATDLISMYDAIESRLLIQSVFGYVWSIVGGALGVAVLSYTYKALSGVDPEAVWTPES
jgi:hypothetical protein